MVTPKEIIEALRFVATPYTESLANRIEAEGIAPPDGMVLVPLSEFPLFDDNGLDEVAHHCEWSMQQDRKRIHACAAAPKGVSHD